MIFCLHDRTFYVVGFLRYVLFEQKMRGDRKHEIACLFIINWFSALRRPLVWVWLVANSIELHFDGTILVARHQHQCLSWSFVPYD